MNCQVQILCFTRKSPPILATQCTHMVSPHNSISVGLHLLFHDCHAIRITLCLLQGPVTKVNHPATRGLIGTRVQVLAVQVGGQHICVTSILLHEPLGLLRSHDEAHTENVRADEC